MAINFLAFNRSVAFFLFYLQLYITSRQAIVTEERPKYMYDTVKHNGKVSIVNDLPEGHADRKQ